MGTLIILGVACLLSVVRGNIVMAGPLMPVNNPFSSFPQMQMGQTMAAPAFMGQAVAASPLMPMGQAVAASPLMPVGQAVAASPLMQIGQEVATSPLMPMGRPISASPMRQQSFTYVANPVQTTSYVANPIQTTGISRAGLLGSTFSQSSIGTNRGISSLIPSTGQISVNPFSTAQNHHLTSYPRYRPITSGYRPYRPRRSYPLYRPYRPTNQLTYPRRTSYRPYRPYRPRRPYTPYRPTRPYPYRPRSGLRSLTGSGSTASGRLSISGRRLSSRLGDRGGVIGGLPDFLPGRGGSSLDSSLLDLGLDDMSDPLGQDSFGQDLFGEDDFGQDPYMDNSYGFDDSLYSMDRGASGGSGFDAEPKYDIIVGRILQTDRGIF